MWNEKLEQKAAAMRARFSRMAEFLREPTQGAVHIADRIPEEARINGLKKAWEKKRKEGDAHRHRVIEITTNNMQIGKTIRDPAKRVDYPACPHCNGSLPQGTIRAGVARGILTRYRYVLQCRATFSGPTVFVKLEIGSKITK